MVFRNIEETKNKITLDLELLDKVEEIWNLELSEREERQNLKRLSGKRKLSGGKNRDVVGLRKWMEILNFFIGWLM